MTAIGCGACVEDKIAATYDHAVIAKAYARHHAVVFASVDRNGSSKIDMHEISRVAAAGKGIDARSVRVSEEPAALSFSLDPATRAPAAALADMQKRLRALGVRLTLLRIVNRSEEVRPRSESSVRRTSM